MLFGGGGGRFAWALVADEVEEVFRLGLFTAESRTGLLLRLGAKSGEVRTSLFMSTEIAAGRIFSTQLITSICPRRMVTFSRARFFKETVT